MKTTKVFKLREDAILPIRAHSTDAGADLFCLEDVFIEVGQTVRLQTGIAMEIPAGHVGEIKGRSSMNARGIIAANGIIDSGYNGDLSVILNNFSCSNCVDPILHRRGVKILRGERIAQLLISEVKVTELVETAVLWASERGSKGFGSSGK